MSRRTDPVTPEVAQAVLARDHGCIAPWIDPWADPCAGGPTLAHVQDAAGMGKGRAPSDPGHLVVLCRMHHLGGRQGHVWALARKAYTRMYLKAIRRGLSRSQAIAETRRALIDDQQEVFR